MKRFPFFILLNLSLSSYLAQDKILFRDSTIVECKILEISESDVTYIPKISSDSSVKIVPKYLITKISLKNGHEEFVNELIKKGDENTTSYEYPITPSTKNNFFRWYFSDIYFLKLTFGYKKRLKSNYSFELDGFYQFLASSQNSGARTNALICDKGFELKAGIGKSYSPKTRQLTFIPSISYRQQSLNNRVFYVPSKYSGTGYYEISQTRKGIGAFMKFNAHFNPERSSYEFFILLGGYLAQTKNEYNYYNPEPTDHAFKRIYDPAQIPKLSPWYLKDGFSLFPYMNAGFSYVIRQPEKGWYSGLKKHRDSMAFKRKNVVLYNFWELAEMNAGITYIRIFYPQALSVYSSLTFAYNNNGPLFSNGILLEGDYNYYLTKKDFDINLSLNYNYGRSRQSFGFIGPMVRTAMFQGAYRGSPFTLNKKYAGINIGFLARAYKGFSFLMSLSSGLYFNNYTKNNPANNLSLNGKYIIDKGAFINSSFQFGYSF